jgi:hypothetical protein
MVVFYRFFGFVGVAVATSTGLFIINVARVIEVKYFYNIFTFEYENLLLTVIVLGAFCVVRLIGILPANIILMLSLNLLTGTILAVLMTAFVSKFMGLKLVNINIEKYMNRSFIIDNLKRLK